MTIKTKLRIIVLLSVGVIAVVAGVVYVLFDHADRAGETVALAEAIAKNVIEQRIVADEYLLYHEERAKEQWQSKETAIESLLAQARDFTGTSAGPIVAILASDHAGATALFKEIVDDHEKLSASDTDAGASEELEKRLASQLLIKTQATVSDAFALASSGRAEATANQHLSLLISSFCLLLLVLLIGAIVFLFERSIVSPLLRLSDATRVLAAGDLAHRVSIRTHDELGDLAASFNDMAEKLAAYINKEVAVERAKVQFLTIAAHQMRTPLTAIKWALQSLVEGEYGVLPKEQQDVLSQAAASTAAMTSIADELLNASDIETGSFTYDFQFGDLKALLTDVMHELQPMIEKKKLRLESEIPDLPLVHIDPDKLRIVFGALLTNAIDYTAGGGEVSVHARATKEYAEVDVIDTGVGIPLAEHDKVFTKLFRGSIAVGLKANGSGLGLYLARAIVEGHGGTITFTSDLGKGTRFTVRLPLRARS